MTAVPGTQAETTAERIQRRKQELARIRERARRLFVEGAMGVQIASMLSELLDMFAVSIFEETLAEFPEAERDRIRRHSSMVAIGGTGRGEVAPYSDADLLFLFRSQISDEFDRFSKRFVAEFWDAGIKLGQRVQTVSETIRKAKDDPHLASSLVHIRCLWGDEALTEQLRHRFYLRVVRRRRRAFIEDCVRGRDEERTQHGATGQQLEPDVKRSLGGLRDLHLLQWVAFAHYGTADIDALRQKDALTRDDTTRLRNATEFVTRVRIDLHLNAGRPADLLSREEQLRISESREITPTGAQRPVERFMQQFFMHSTAIAEISQRFVRRHRVTSFSELLHQATASRRVNRYFILRPGELDIIPSRLDHVSATLEDLLKILHSAALYRVALSPRLVEAIRQAACRLRPGPSPQVGQLFLEILSTTGRMAATVRTMHETGVLDLVIPEWTRVRCLMQFNQYHHFTVDEHTLRCLEICEGFGQEDTPLSAAYRNTRSREILHLSLLLHDAGKGFEEDHCEVGQRLALDVCHRLGMSEHQTGIVRFLVKHHLEMADLAFRHDISDEKLQVQFGHVVGTPEKLRMLFVLTAADVSGVGPGIWNQWKADLLTDFFERLMLTLSGQPPRYHEEERLRTIREHVCRSIVPLESGENDEQVRRWVDQQLHEFTSHYLTTTSPDRIAADLDIIRGLESNGIHVEGRCHPDAGTVDYRIITDASHARGCFHLISGVLAARHMQILGAEIATSTGNVVVDVFHVIDRDFSSPVPPGRIEETADTIRDVLSGVTTVEELFRRHRRYSGAQSLEVVMQLETRVDVDNDTSDRCTVISVFAHDRTGLLYTISRTLYQLGLSIEVARIATYFDQIVDVFYVTDVDGRKIESGPHIQAIKDRLLTGISDFELQSASGRNL